MQEITKKVAFGENITKMQKGTCKIALLSSKSATKSLKPHAVFCFVLISNPA